jgi:hypothetical protein
MPHIHNGNCARGIFSNFFLHSDKFQIAILWRIHILDTTLLYRTRLLANTNVMFFPVLEIRDNLNVVFPGV